jgi:oxygen-independent coproporphyrinogen-3 oxidase
LWKNQTISSDIYIANINHYKRRRYDTVYFGGGTPSIEDPRWAREILQSIEYNANAEITMEANPRDINLQKLNDWKEAGINRISLGVQTFNTRIAEILGRDSTIEVCFNNATHKATMIELILRNRGERSI